MSNHPWWLMLSFNAQTNSFWVFNFPFIPHEISISRNTYIDSFTKTVFCRFFCWKLCSSPFRCFYLRKIFIPEINETSPKIAAENGKKELDLGSLNAKFKKLPCDFESSAFHKSCTKQHFKKNLFRDFVWSFLEKKLSCSD